MNEILPRTVIDQDTKYELTPIHTMHMQNVSGYQRRNRIGEGMVHPRINFTGHKYSQPRTYKKDRPLGNLKSSRKGFGPSMLSPVNKYLSKLDSTQDVSLNNSL